MKLIIVMFILVLLTGCEMRSWDSVVTECKEEHYDETCGYVRCLQENSANFNIREEVNSDYIYCQLTECRAMLENKT